MVSSLARCVLLFSRGRCHIKESDMLNVSVIITLGDIRAKIYPQGGIGYECLANNRWVVYDECDNERLEAYADAVRECLLGFNGGPVPFGA